MTADANVNASKSQPVVGILLTALATLLIVGLVSFAGPCEPHGQNVSPACVWAERAVLGIGVVALILAVVRIFEMDEGERRGLSLSCALLGILTAAVPGALIGLCDDPAMHCNAIMRPFVLVVGLAIGVVGAVDLTRRLLALRN